jgi:ADP-ribosylglycohydrolase/catechol 2,3-dioxygenase-like lactoylglutathione lyase family enzyme
MTQALKIRDADPALVEKSEAAFLGAAIGDALGWPHEMRPRRTGQDQMGDLVYKDWTKRSGGRFQPYEERIAAGSYSDDTQLILAIARCLSGDADHWWGRFAFQELPFWTLYERGGGGATKRSATSWMSGNPPWKGKEEDVRRYFEAGGNGVAMRILPHCIVLADSDDFEPVARNVLADGVATHGHPRALLGALLYAFALWTALRHRGTLAFGELVAQALSSIDIWSRLPAIEPFWPDWSPGVAPASYHRVWEETVHEQVQLLELAMRAIEAGAASFDEECLENLGCFDKRVNGSGTVTAAGALYLASRHAADPGEGLRVAALARGADTDTLASMTCALLGAAVGSAWLGQYLEALQDRDALVGAARKLLRIQPSPAELSRQRVSRASIASFKAQLREQGSGPMRLPIGIDAQVEPWDGLNAKGPAIEARGWVARAETGQTFFIKIFSRETKPSAPLFERHGADRDTNLSVRLAVTDLGKSRRFYEDALGLQVNREGARALSFGRALAISAEDPDQVSPGSILLYIEVSDLALRFDRLHAGGAHILSEIAVRADRRHFRCADPDGYRLELYEKIR